MGRAKAKMSMTKKALVAKRPNFLRIKLMTWPVVRYSDDVNDPQVEGFVTIIDNLAARARFMQPF